MMIKTDRRRIVSSWAGQGTAETIWQDDHGNTYREVTPAEARNIEQSTAGRVYRIRDGWVE